MTSLLTALVAVLALAGVVAGCVAATPPATTRPRSRRRPAPAARDDLDDLASLADLDDLADLGEAPAVTLPSAASVRRGLPPIYSPGEWPSDRLDDVLTVPEEWVTRHHSAR